FLAVGRSRDAEWEAQLREQFAGSPNLELLGFIDQFDSGRLRSVLSESWILVNTSVREGLPTSFLEALANKCAILSSVNPGNATQRFGHFVTQDDFAAGLAKLLLNDAWRALGEAGWNHVRDHFELDAVLQKHVNVYGALIARGRRRPSEPRRARVEQPVHTTTER